MCGFRQAGRQWLQSGCLGCRLIQGSSLTILSMGSLLEGFPKIRPGGIRGTNLAKRLLVPVEQWQRWRALKWCTKSGNGHCQVQCRCWMFAAEWPDLSWMIKLFWKAMLRYRKASYVMFSRKSVQLHGRALLDKGLRSPLCCLAVRWQMTGLTSCCRKGTHGPPLLPRGLSQRWLPKRPFVKNGADCKLSIFGWRSSWAGMCCPTGCAQWPLLGSHVSNYMSCNSTGLPGAAERIPMKRKHTVDLPTEKSRHGGSNAKSGCCITNANVRHWSWTLKAFCMHSGARKRMLVLRLMHIWNIAQSGGKQERALTSSSDDDSCRMWETRLSKKMQKWTWRTSDLIHGWHGGFHGGRVFFPKQCGNTWGSYGNSKKPGL